MGIAIEIVIGLAVGFLSSYAIHNIVKKDSKVALFHTTRLQKIYKPGGPPEECLVLDIYCKNHSNRHTKVFLKTDTPITSLTLIDGFGENDYYKIINDYHSSDYLEVDIGPMQHMTRRKVVFRFDRSKLKKYKVKVADRRVVSNETRAKSMSILGNLSQRHLLIRLFVACPFRFLSNHLPFLVSDSDGTTPCTAPEHVPRLCTT